MIYSREVEQLETILKSMELLAEATRDMVEEDRKNFIYVLASVMQNFDLLGDERLYEIFGVTYEVD